MKTSKSEKKPYENRFADIAKKTDMRKFSELTMNRIAKPRDGIANDLTAAKVDDNKQQDQAYYDTGASNHMSPVIPENLDRSTKGSIETATGDKTPLLGSSKFKLGQVVVENVLCAPGLDFNLVSGSQLAKEGYSAVIDMKNDHDLTIKKNGLVVATGDFNDQDLLVINEDFTPVNKPVKKVTFKTQQPLPTANPFSLLKKTKDEHIMFGHLGCTSDTCDICMETKRRRRNTPKASTPKEALEVLEKVHVDIQGPFPIPSCDGSRMNIKAVDSHSGYVKMELIHNKTASTTLDFLKRYHTRSERQTGKVLKAILPILGMNLMENLSST